MSSLLLLLKGWVYLRAGLAVVHGVGALVRDFLSSEVAQEFRKLAVGNAKAKIVSGFQ